MFTTSAVLALAMQCAPSIHPATLLPILRTESSFNPWAIGVVGKPLPRQPRTSSEALAAVKALVGQGADFSIGLGQINRQHFDVNKPEQVFEPCTNLRMTAEILQACYSTARRDESNHQIALRKAISCYYSGNVKRGFEPEKLFGGTSHVQRVLANAEGSPVTVPALKQDTQRVPPDQPPSTAPPPANGPQPTYESWDVLRQYPRYAPPVPSAPPPVLATPPQAIPTNEKELPDA